MKRLPIYETFFSWQGEGCHMGKSAFFIRLFGCPVHCPWCDSAGTWHPGHIPERIEKRTIEELVAEATEQKPQLVIITGGEPCIHDLSGLTDALQNADMTVHLETSGAFPVQGTFDWITVSPKVWKKPIQSCIEQADEFKLIVDSSEAVSLWEQEIGKQFIDRPIWLHPEWSKRADPKILGLINACVKEGKHLYRAGYQLHKLYRVDEEDVRSKPTVNLTENAHR
ncbi:MAG: 7-carboxy-7-deazaguanine synthase QueE [Verrucomicrobia bacterium]|nr:7-carboxy-7-deazaguanine synthase QueE [Verrucomicrobiota bacterium]